MALTKTKQTVYTPAVAGSPGSPGTPPTPGYYMTVTTPATYGLVLERVWPDSYRSIFPFNTFSEADWQKTADEVWYVWREITPASSKEVFVPPTPGTPPVAGVPGTPSSTKEEFNLGWTGSAVSVAVQSGDFILSLGVKPDTVGIVAGINDVNLGSGYKDINYSFYFNQGKALVYESGVQKSSLFAVAPGDIFGIMRTGNSIVYLKNSEPVYASETPSTGTVFADASLYSGGDSITSAEWSTVTTKSLSGTIAGVGAISINSTLLYGQIDGVGTLVPARIRVDGKVDLPAAVNNGVGTATGNLTVDRALSGTLDGVGAMFANASIQKFESFGAFLPLRGLSSDKPYAESIGYFKPISGSAETGELTPTYALSSGYMEPLLGTSLVLTGEMISSDAGMEPLWGLSANRPYGEARGTFSPLGGFSVQMPIFDGIAKIKMPALKLVGYGHDSAGEEAATIVMPSPTLVGYGGANAELRLPKPLVTLTATNAATGTAEIVTPKATITATGTVSGLGRANLTFGYVNGGTYGLVGYSGAVLSVTLPIGTLTATGSAGSVGSAAITLPLFELTATGTVKGLSFANVTMPMPYLAPTARAALVMPFGVLTAIGTATVTVAYEAYALNLNHKTRGREEPVDEMTRYTNYPFDRIVRYQNSYFGMNSTGLYLLEGTTDEAVPIDWTVQTAFTDFDSPQLKTVEMAYFGGRLGPAATVSLLVSENNTKTYTYTTPRDTDAQNYRQTFGRGNKARYYAMGATGSGDMSIDSITFNVASMARKV